MKKVVLLSLGLLLLCFPLVSCDSGEGLAAEEIAQIVEGVGDSEMDTCTFEMDISGNIDVDAFGESMEMNINGGGKGCLDNVNQEMCMPLTVTMNADIPFAGPMNEVMSMEVYVVDGWMYTKSNGEWTKMELPQDMWEEQSGSMPIGELTDLLDLVELEHKGSEEINGVDCYKFQATPDLEQMVDYMLEEFQQPGMDDFELDGLDEIISAFNVDCTIWISEGDNNRIMKIAVVVSGDLSSEDMEGMGDVDFGSDMNMSVDLSMDIEFEYDQPVNIELPEAAANACEVGSYDTDW